VPKLLAAYDALSWSPAKPVVTDHATYAGTRPVVTGSRNLSATGPQTSRGDAPI
jgi:hypothetical protein